jgi:phospholipid/cholesterol/gamma-HCH transport system substrate-binding protein
MTPITHFPRHLALVLITFGVAVFAALGFAAIGGYLRIGGDTYEVTALVPTSSNLTTGARVTMAGVEVGRVSSVQRRGTGSLLKLALTSDEVTPLPSDSRIAVRVRTPIGENYVSINRGRAASDLKSGGMLPVTQADDFVDVDQILSVMQGTTAQRTRQLVQGLAAGLHGRGRQLNETLRGVGDTFVPATRIVDTLDRHRYRVSRLVDQLGRLSSSLAERDASIRGLAEYGLQAFRAVGSRDDRLRALLRELPPTLSQARTTMGTLESTTGTTAPVLANLARAVRDLRPAVKSLRPAAQEGRGVFRELGLAAPRLSSTLSRVRSASKPVANLIPQVHGVLCQVNPMLEYLKPYVPDLNAFIAGWVSSTNSYDALGHLLRVQTLVNTSNLVGAPAEVRSALRLLQRVGAVSEVVGPLDYNPYPAPGQVGKHSSLNGPQRESAEAFKAGGFKFERVQRECDAGAQPGPNERAANDKH